jgi:hypothetical protein
MTATAREDPDLLAACSNGDEQALGALYDRYGKVAYGVALRVLRDSALAEDAVQDAFVSVWRQAATYDRTRGKASTWILHARPPASRGPRTPQLRSHLEAVAKSPSTYGAIAANVAFVISRSTAGLHPDGYETGLAIERAWQLDRLLGQLGLVVGADA